MPQLKRELDRDALVALAARQYPEEHVILFGPTVIAHGRSAKGVIDWAFEVARRRKILIRCLTHVTPQGRVWRRKPERHTLHTHHVRMRERPAPTVRLLRAA